MSFEQLDIVGTPVEGEDYIIGSSDNVGRHLQIKISIPLLVKADRGHIFPSGKGGSL